MSPDNSADRIPLSWWSAQHSASRLLAVRGARWPAVSFEYRSMHEVFALTLLLSRCGRNLGPGQVSLLRARLADDVEWAVWCQSRLARDTDMRAADAEEAGRAFDRLARSRLLGGVFYDVRSGCTIDARCAGAGLGAGVALARRLLAPGADGYRFPSEWHGDT